MNEAVNNATALSTYTPWPDTNVGYPTINYPTYWWYPATSEEYANEVEVERGEHDAVLRFYRKRGDSAKTLVKEITVPLSLLDVFAPKAVARKRGK